MKAPATLPARLRQSARHWRRTMPRS